MAKKETYVSTSDFTGGALANWGYNFVVSLVTAISLGIAYPWMYCWKKRWECEHTFIDGKQLAFDGNGGQLFGNLIKWTLLSLITFGIYYLVKGKILMIEWETKHTHYAGGVPVEEKPSHFDGKWYQVLGVSLLTGFVTLITLGFGIYWAHCYTERWFASHTQYDGDRLCFDGKGIQYFGVCIKWCLLTIITFGIYSFWMAVKTKQWTIKHTHVDHSFDAPAASAEPQTSAAATTPDAE